MIAIPLDTSDSTLISPLYGNAPFFALLDEQGGAMRVVENTACGNGIKGVELLLSLGITATVFYHMGKGLYARYAKEGVDVFTCKKAPLSIDAIYVQFLKGELQKLDAKNCDALLDAGNCANTCGCEVK